MKNRFFYEIKEDARAFFRTLPVIFTENRRTVLLVTAFLILLSILLHPLDVPFNHTMVENQTEALAKLGDGFRHWGDFRDTVTVTVLLLVTGWLFRHRHWRRVGVTFFLSVCLAGLAVNTLRFTTGRPRPHP